MCSCGHHPRNYFTAAPSMSQMTTHQIMELLENMGHKSCDIRDDGIGRITITTSQPLNQQQQQLIDSCVTAGVKVTFVVKNRTETPLPKGLDKWYKETRKYLK